MSNLFFASEKSFFYSSSYSFKVTIAIKFSLSKIPKPIVTLVTYEHSPTFKLAIFKVAYF